MVPDQEGESPVRRRSRRGIEIVARVQRNDGPGVDVDAYQVVGGLGPGCIGVDAMPLAHRQQRMPVPNEIGEPLRAVAIGYTPWRGVAGRCHPGIR